MRSRVRRISFAWMAMSVAGPRSEEHTSELQSQSNLVCRLLLEKKKTSHVFRPRDRLVQLHNDLAATDQRPRSVSKSLRPPPTGPARSPRSEEHTSELHSLAKIV